MQILVDADACPKAIKNILFKAAYRVQVSMTLVANRSLNIPRSPLIKTLQVPKGFDVADEKIVELVQEGDLVITADNIRHYLSIRNFMTELRNGGVDTGGPAAFSQADCHAFANQLDRFLTQHAKSGG